MLYIEHSNTTLVSINLKQLIIDFGNENNSNTTLVSINRRWVFWKGGFMVNSNTTLVSINHIVGKTFKLYGF